MADLRYVNDTADAVAKAAYAKKAAMGVTNPKAVAAMQMSEAEGDNAVKPPAAVTGTPAMSTEGVKFTKGFTPGEKVAQRAALLQKLKDLDAADAKNAAANQTGAQ